MRLIPYRAYRFVGDVLVGKFMLYAYKREVEKGNLHEARHIAALVQVGNSQPCDRGATCVLVNGTITIPTTLPGQERGRSCLSEEGL